MNQNFRKKICKRYVSNKSFQNCLAEDFRWIKVYFARFRCQFFFGQNNEKVFVGCTKIGEIFVGYFVICDLQGGEKLKYLEIGKTEILLQSPPLDSISSRASPFWIGGAPEGEIEKFLADRCGPLPTGSGGEGGGHLPLFFMPVASAPGERVTFDSPFCNQIIQSLCRKQSVIWGRENPSLPRFHPLAMVPP